MIRASGAEHGAPKLCFSTLGCTELELDAALGLAQSHGIGAIELRGLGGTLDLAAHFESRFGTPGRLGAFLRGQRIAVTAMDTSVNAVGAGVADRQDLLRLLPWASAAGASRIRVFDGGEVGSEAELADMAMLLSWWDQRTAKVYLPPELMIETHDALARPEVLSRFSALCPRASILWDTHHTWHEGGELPSVTWQRIRKMCRHIHIKDSCPGEDGRFQYVAPGSGTFPHLELIETLAAEKYSGYISLEWERHWFPILPPVQVPLSSFLALYRANLPSFA